MSAAVSNEFSCTPPAPSPPYTPGRDYPDDNAGVVSTLARAPTDPGPVTSFDSADWSRYWRRIAGVGIEKGIPALADFGTTMWLLETGTEPARRTEELTDESKVLIASAVSTMETKYSADITRPEEALPRAAHIAVLQAGFSGGVAALLDRFGYTYVAVDVDFDPLGTAADFPVLVIPSGGLYGTSGSRDVRERLAAYTAAGGTLIVLAQMHGADYAPVPTPEGQPLHGYGWFEDQSCWRDSVRIARKHPVTASSRTVVLSVPVDGFFDAWPASSEILLYRTAGGNAALLTYPLGNGRVVVSTTFEDWAESNGAGTNDGRQLMANLLHWARSPNVQRPTCALGEACDPSLTVLVRNLTDSPADTIEWTIADALGGSPATGTWRQSLGLGPGAVVEVPVTVHLDPSDRPFVRPGIWRLSYRLLDSTRELQRMAAEPIPWQSQSSAEAAQVIFEAWPDDIPSAPELTLGLTVDSEYILPYSSIPAHLSIHNSGRDAFRGQLRLSYMAPAMDGRHFLTTVEVVVPPGRSQVLDVTAGPLVLQPGHDGLPGGAQLRAELTGGDDSGPILTVAKNVITNVHYLNTTFQASEAQAGPGDTVTFGGRLANQSQGSLNLRYRLVHQNVFNILGDIPGETRSDWREVTLGPNQVADYAEPFVIPDGWQGLLRTHVVFCLEAQPCWASGDDRKQVWFRSYTDVAVPMSHVTLDLREVQPVTGPVFRLPVLVRNTGIQPVVAGQLRLRLAGTSEATVISDTFELARGEERELTFDLPFDTGADFTRGRWTITADFTDRLWTAYSPEYPWTFAVSTPVRYDVRVAPVVNVSAPAGVHTATGTVAIENRSTFGRRLSVHTTCADVGFDEVREIEVGPEQHARLDFSVPIPPDHPYGFFPLVFHVEDGYLVNLERQYLLACPDGGPLITSRVDGVPREGEPVDLVLQLRAFRAEGEISGSLELTCETPSIDETRQIAVPPREPNEQVYSIPIPTGNPGGEYVCGAHWSEPNGHTTDAVIRFVVPPADFAPVLTDTRAVAGGNLVYEVRNRGSVTGVFDATVTLRDASGVVAQPSVQLSVAPDATESASFPIPSSARSGRYLAQLAFHQPGSSALAAIPSTVEITGVESTLAVHTSKEVFHLGEPMDGWGEITNGPMPLDGATLRLEVIARTDGAGCAPPWGLFQRDPGRSGASPVGGEIVGHMWYILMGDPISRTTFHAEAAADIDSTGRDSVIAVEDDGGGNVALSVYDVPLYRWRRARSVPLADVADPVELAVADTDHDGVLEIFLASFADDGGFVLRAFRPDLTQIWELDEPVADDPGSPFPGGSPIPVDVDGDGIDEIVVSTGRDTLVVRGDSGALVWRVSTHVDLTGWQVTGIAASDLDGDGPPEISLGLRAEDSEAGRVLCLEHDGTLRWSADTAHPIAGSPVHVVADISTPSIAYLDTPTDPVVSSTLDVRRAGDGQLELETATPFWSAFQPAAADVTGDGSTDFVVAAGVPDCTTCGLDGPLVFSQSGAVVWSGTYPGTAPPILIDSDVDGTPDVAMAVDQGSLESQGLWVWRGRDGASLAYMGDGVILQRHPLRVLVPYGDCAPVILSGNRVVFGGVEIGAPQHGPAQASLADGDVVWSWEGPLELAAGATTTISQLFTTQGNTGLFDFVGTLRNEARQVLARDEVTFSVVNSQIELAVSRLPHSIPLDEPTTLEGHLRNSGTTQETLTLRIAFTPGSTTEQTIDLDAGGEQPFSLPLPTNGGAETRVHIEVLDGGQVVATGAGTYAAERPAVTASIAPQTWSREQPIPIVAHIQNTTHLALDLSASLRLGDRGPGDAQPLHLGPEDAADLVFWEEVRGTTTVVLGITGDVVMEVSGTAACDPSPTIALASPVTVPVGAGVVRLRATHPGNVRFTGTLDWHVAPCPSCDGSVELVLDPGESRDVDVPVDLPVGGATVSADIDATQATFEIETYVGGRGTLQLPLAARVSAGLIDVPVDLANLLDVPGTFSLHAEAHHLPDGQLAAEQDRTWTLAASDHVSDSFPIVLAPGDYQLAGWLNGEGQPAAERGFTATPRVSAQLTATVQELLADGTLPVGVTITNASAESLAATLSLSGIGPAVFIPVRVEGGSARDLVVPLPLDALSTGSLPLALELLDGSGELLARQDIEFEVLPANLVVTPPPAMISGSAGDDAHVTLIVVNTGHQSASIELQADLGNGAVAAASRAVTVAGLSTTDIDLPLRLPADLAAGDAQGHYLLLSQPGGPETITTVAEGSFTVDVAALPLEVETRLDRDHADAGETVSLSLDVSSPGLVDGVPAFVIAGYGAFQERRDVTLSVAPVSLTFDVPIDEPGGVVTTGVYATSGRALRLDQLTIWPRTGDVVITADRSEYAPGEVAHLAVSLSADGAFEAVGFEQERTLDSSGSIDLAIPLATPRGRYPVAWTFFRPGPAGPLNGVFTVAIRGPSVRITDIAPSTHRAMAGQVVTATVEAISDTGLDGRLLAWLRAPSGTSALEADTPVSMAARQRQTWSLDVPIDTSEAGTHDIVVAIEAADETPLADAAARVDVGLGHALGLSVGPSTPPARDGALSAFLVTQGRGSGLVALLVDGAPLLSSRISLDGIGRTELPLPSLDPGVHGLTAQLTVDGSTSSASTTFRVDAPPSPCQVVAASPAQVWPADLSMVAIGLIARDSPGPRPPAFEILSVSQDEPVLDPPESTDTPDATLAPLQVRAQRADGGDGRVYHVTFRRIEDDGTDCTGEVTVCVPLSPQTPCIDGGALYDSTQP